MVSVGILALQGDFAEHRFMMEPLGAQVYLVKHGSQLASLDALIIPGGESTTIARLTSSAGDSLLEAVRMKASEGLPVYGTCMGAIFLAREIEGSSQGRLALMDIKVRRNAFGPQRFSREQMLNIPSLGSEPFPAIFIRGPVILNVWGNVEVLSAVEEGIVMARQDNLLVSAFHPELTGDSRVHRYFLEMVRQRKQMCAASRWAGDVEAGSRRH